jgi:hypothetical protein
VGERRAWKAGVSFFLQAALGWNAGVAIRKAITTENGPTKLRPCPISLLCLECTMHSSYT